MTGLELQNGGVSRTLALGNFGQFSVSLCLSYLTCKLHMISLYSSVENVIN